MMCPNCGCALNADVSVTLGVAAQPVAVACPDAEKVTDLPLSKYTMSMIQYGFQTVDQLCSVTAADMLRRRGIGRGRLTEIRVALARCGRSLAADGEWYSDWCARNGGAV